MAAVPPDATEYILGELTRRLNEVASRLEVGLGRMDGVYVRRDVYDQAMATARQEHATMQATMTAEVTALKVEDKAIRDTLGARLQKLEESRQWAFRMSVGALVSGLVSILVAVILIVGGLK